MGREDLNAVFDGLVKDLYGSQAKVSAAERWGGGALNHCYALRLEPSGERLFVKIENDEIYPSTRRGQVEREVYGARLARAAGIDCPQVLAWNFDRQAGVKYAVSEFIDADLIWEIKDSLSEVEREGIRRDAGIILERMNAISSPVFGDLYPEGVLGQHAAWPDAYAAAWKLLLADALGLEALDSNQYRVAEEALPACLEHITGRHIACFNHGDLGIHNMLADRSDGYVRISKVIDFGNATFTPVFLHDDSVRLHAGLGLEMVDVEQKYGVGPKEYEASSLLGLFEWVIFARLLKQRYNHDRGDQVASFMDACRRLLS